MKIARTVLTLSLVIGSLIHYGIASAHGTEKHEHMVPVDTQMMKLHAMMPLFMRASAGMETALNNGDAEALVTEGEKITTAIPDLKKSVPHRNSTQREKFVARTTQLEKAVVTTVALGKKGLFTEAKATFKKVEAACASCHATFRD